MIYLTSISLLLGRDKDFDWALLIKFVALLVLIRHAFPVRPALQAQLIALFIVGLHLLEELIVLWTGIFISFVLALLGSATEEMVEGFSLEATFSSMMNDFARITNSEKLQGLLSCRVLARSLSFLSSLRKV
ncbi:hypothetical protein AXF42_Ash013396 [Apostasia shenzhenica]|uniref:Uncharacterized protein n=1 Tax=Apostasia shenzhenica TaxID=1088818 RepID=A0A2I0A434_9ASPA|nr:hypothetical protein AXF42_Ash013396 [Apostasia shenzhenica]